MADKTRERSSTKRNNNARQFRSADSNFHLDYMAIDQTEVIDFVSTDKITGDVIVTISDHLDWDSDIYHLEILQKKLNAYIAFVETEQIYKDYPNSKGNKIIFQIVSKYEYPKRGQEFLIKANEITNSIGIKLRLKVL